MIERLRDRLAARWWRLKGAAALIVFGLALVLGLSGCQSAPPKWQGWRYDNQWRAHPL